MSADLDLLRDKAAAALESRHVPRSSVALPADESPPIGVYEGEPRANGHAPPVPRVLPGINFADMRPHLDDNYIAKRLLGRTTLVGVIGPSGEGKTFFCTNLAVYIAANTTWRTHKIRGGLVVYVALEGAASAENRFCAARSALNVPHGIPLKLTPGPVNLRAAADVDCLISTVRAAESEHGAKCVAIFLDTLNRAMCGGDENSSEDMGALIAGADRVRLATDATVILLHHTGKDASRGGRGHSSFKGALDTEIEVVKSGNVHVATVTKQRDYAGGARYAFALEVVELGQDSDGEEVTTCIVRTADEPATQRQTPRGKHQTAMLAALQEWQRQHPGVGHISSMEFRGLAKTQGIDRKRLSEAVESLSRFGWLATAIGGYTLLPEAAI